MAALFPSYPDHFIPQVPAHDTYAQACIFDWDRRMREHMRGNPSTLDYSPNHDYLGKAGEWQYFYERSLVLDMSIRDHGGDGGWDHIPGGWKTDIKTANKPTFLLRPVKLNHLPAMIYVLAGFNEINYKVTLLGWEYNNILEQCEKRKFRQKDGSLGVLNYFKPAGQLRPIWELDYRTHTMRWH